VGAIAALTMVVTLFVIIFRSGSSAEETADRKQRAAGNGMPGWVGIVGPILFWLGMPIVERALGMLRALFSAAKG
jgi:hypothetical protein